MAKSSRYDAVVIGGGFFGCKLSLYLKQYMKHVLILEKEPNLLQRASYANQARVHNGYHYPRSILTGLRSRVSFPQFVNEYRECIAINFDNYYAVSQIFSKVNANQFKTFCERIGSPIELAPRSIKKLFNGHLIEEVFCTKEYAFDAVKLKERMYSELEKEKVEVKFKAEVFRLKNHNDSAGIEVDFQTESGCERVASRYVFNCTYSALNKILSASNLPTIPLKHELAEMSLVEVPEPVKYLGITVMCGPFFSIMPFPPRNLHTLSHVRYTPHCYWQDTEDSASAASEIYRQAARQTNYPHMIRDAARYMPILKSCRYVDSLWEVKTVLPQSEVDDSRPILFKRNQRLPNLTCVLGGKIDNVYDLPGEIQFLEGEGEGVRI
ncbi:FAD-dependent oxidoreductase [Synechococcus sp. PCC 7336]|uniref:FAD-dependent oxidoreductase n=1 Tax=Synechococcus sp. PCC 7336 TaxID=195250 RepID=UPI0004761611|nr:FAD-dependent oxidoreductase [Synechococcus sp. PCC 7336]